MLLPPRLLARSLTTLLILLFSPGFLNTLWNDTLLSSWLYSETLGKTVTPHCTIKKPGKYRLRNETGECFFFQSLKNTKSSAFFKGALIATALVIIARGNYQAVFLISLIAPGFPAPCNRRKDGFLRPVRLPVRMATPPCIYLI
jgi:hypothetical protein